MVAFLKRVAPFVGVAVLAIIVDRKTGFLSGLIARVAPSLVAGPSV